MKQIAAVQPPPHQIFFGPLKIGATLLLASLMKGTFGFDPPILILPGPFSSLTVGETGPTTGPILGPILGPDLSDLSVEGLMVLLVLSF